LNGEVTMIENERQYRLTKAQRARLEEGLARSQKPPARVHRRLHQAMMEGLQDVDLRESVRL
jgi:hypothetical protein